MGPFLTSLVLVHTIFEIAKIEMWNTGRADQVQDVLFSSIKMRIKPVFTQDSAIRLSEH
jgi:hypothetical protein